MPTKKRRKLAMANNDAQQPNNVRSSMPVSLAGFMLLPREIKQIVFEMACRSFASVAWPSRSPFSPDNDTAFSLALVCRDINAQITPLAWREVSITRPSALWALHQALVANPDRAKLIRSLHIGPQDTLPSYWWPLSRTIFVERFKRSTIQWIASSLDAAHLPSGCRSRAAWRWDSGTAGCRDAAIYKALEVIKESLGLQESIHGQDEPATTVPAYEAQAALDLYLGEIRRIEEGNPELLRLVKPGARVPVPCRYGNCVHYPALVIKDVPQRLHAKASTSLPAPSGRPSNVIIISYSQILCHLARAGAVTDRFDHPLVLARSGFRAKIMLPSVETSSATAYYPSRARYTLHSSSWDITQHERGRWPGKAVLQEAMQQARSSGHDASRYAAAMGTGTIGAVLSLARTVLDGAINLQNVSLTGYLEAALYQRGLPSSMQRLSIGPALPGWEAPLPTGKVEHVEELRICGRSMTKYDAWPIAVRMQGLKRLEWSLAEPFKSMFRHNIVDVINLLLTTSAATAAAASEPSTASPPEEQSEQDSGDPSLPLIVARLHWEDEVAVVRSAPSDEIRTAWQNGRPVSTFCRRLHVTGCAAAMLVVRSDHDIQSSPQWSNSPRWEEMYSEGREFWRGEFEGEEVLSEEEDEDEEQDD